MDGLPKRGNHVWALPFHTQTGGIRADAFQGSAPGPQAANSGILRAVADSWTETPMQPSCQSPMLVESGGDHAEYDWPVAERDGVGLRLFLHGKVMKSAIESAGHCRVVGGSRSQRPVTTCITLASCKR